MLCTELNSDRLPFFKLGYTMNPNHILVFFFFSKTKQLDHMSIWFKWNEFSSYIRGFLAVRYEGESISNQPNLFPVEIHNFFSDVIVLLCDALRPLVFKCHQPRTEKVRFFSIDLVLKCRHDFFVRPEMTSTDILFQVWDWKKSLGDGSGE